VDLGAFGESKLPAYIKASQRIYENRDTTKKNIIEKYLKTRSALHIHARVHFKMTEGILPGQEKHYLLSTAPFSSHPLNIAFKVLETEKKEISVRKLKG
jgi:hypothetical protein